MENRRDFSVLNCKIFLFRCGLVLFRWLQTSDKRKDGLDNLVERNKIEIAAQKNTKN